MTTASPITTLWTALERAEPRYQRALEIETRLERVHGVNGDSLRLRRATAVVDALGRQTSAIIGMMVDLPSTTFSDLSLKAALAVRREDDVAVLQSVARDVLSIAVAGFTPRQRTGALLTPAQLAGVTLR